MTRVIVRGFARGQKIFQQRHACQTDEEISALIAEHAQIMAPYELHYLEVEFLDELDPLARFYRFGTDPSAMVMPIGIDLTHFHSFTSRTGKPN